jgi:hypothetical protein
VSNGAKLQNFEEKTIMKATKKYKITLKGSISSRPRASALSARGLTLSRKVFYVIACKGSQKYWCQP